MSFKSEAKASRAGKHSAMGLGGHKAKALDVGPGHTWDGQPGLSTEEKVNEPQRVPTRKAGGKVEGHAAKRRMDRAPRKAGGRVGKASGGKAETPAESTARYNREKAEYDAKSPQQKMGASIRGPDFESSRKRGGRVHSDEAEDRKLIDKMVKPSARTGKADGGGNWIGSAIKHPGALHKELGVAKGEKIPAKKLAKAAHSDDPKLAKRARLAETLKHMPHKDGGRAERASGGKVGKGKTNITIVVAPGGAGQQPQPPVVPRPVPVPVPAAPPPGAGAPPMAGMGPPSGSPAMGGMPPVPMMPRASGGRVARYPGGGVGASPQLAGAEQPVSTASANPLSGGNGFGQAPAGMPWSPQINSTGMANAMGDIRYQPQPVMSEDGRTMYNPQQINLPPPSFGFKNGGRVPRMDAGAGSGEGRLEKIELQKKAGRRG